MNNFIDDSSSEDEDVSSKQSMTMSERQTASTDHRLEEEKGGSEHNSA